MSAELLSRLAAPFHPDAVDWRLGTMKQDKTGGMALAYIDARTVQDRLDEVCGAFWACEHVVSGDKRVTCRIGIKVGDEWVFRSDGAGETDVEGEKGSYSDSFKRAAVKWGIGRYLYDLASPWVDVEPAGRSFRIKASEQAKLRAILTGAQRQHAQQSSPQEIAQVNQKGVAEWRKEIAACASVADLEALARMPEFKKEWADWNQPTRDAVQRMLSTAKATFNSRGSA